MKQPKIEFLIINSGKRMLVNPIKGDKILFFEEVWLGLKLVRNSQSSSYDFKL